MPQDSDEALVAQAVKGDESAAENLIRRHYDTIHRLARRISGNDADAEDIAQEVCIKLGRALAGFDRRAAFASWLYRITLNTALDMRRQDARQQARTEDLRHLSAPATLPDQETAVAAEEMWAIILSLAEKQRDAVILVIGEGLTHKQAAAVIGCAPGTVGWLLNRAMARLTEIMEGERHGPEHHGPERPERDPEPGPGIGALAVGQGTGGS